jgi:hypothetical protein
MILLHFFFNLKLFNILVEGSRKLLESKIEEEIRKEEKEKRRAERRKEKEKRKKERKERKLLNKKSSQLLEKTENEKSVENIEKNKENDIKNDIEENDSKIITPVNGRPTYSNNNSKDETNPPLISQIESVDTSNPLHFSSFKEPNPVTSSESATLDLSSHELVEKNEGQNSIDFGDNNPPNSLRSLLDSCSLHRLDVGLLKDLTLESIPLRYLNIVSGEFNTFGSKSEKTNIDNTSGNSLIQKNFSIALPPFNLDKSVWNALCYLFFGPHSELWLQKYVTKIHSGDENNNNDENEKLEVSIVLTLVDFLSLTLPLNNSSKTVSVHFAELKPIFDVFLHLQNLEEVDFEENKNQEVFLKDPFEESKRLKTQNKQFGISVVIPETISASYAIEMKECTFKFFFFFIKQFLFLKKKLHDF